MTYDEVMALPPATRDIMRWDLSSRWCCLLCGELVFLRIALVIGNYGCPGCGMTCLRPQYYELPPWDGVCFTPEDPPC